MIQNLFCLLMILNALSCTKEVFDPSRQVILETGTAELPENIDSWAGIMYVFQDDTGVSVTNIDRLSEMPATEYNDGDRVTLVAFERADFISADSGIGLPSGEYLVKADIVGEEMPAIWSGTCASALAGSEVKLSLLPVTASVNLRVENAPKSFNNAVMNIDGLVNDAYCPSEGTFTSIKYDSMEIGFSAEQIGFNMFPMKETDASSWRASFEFDYGVSVLYATFDIGRKVVSGDEIEILFDMAAFETESLVRFRYASHNVLTGEEYQIEKIFMPSSSSDGEVITEFNSHYNVFVKTAGSWEPVKVYDALCSDASKHEYIWNDWGNDKQLRDTMSYCIFEHPFDGPVSVRIQKKDKPFSEVEVRPSAWNIPVRDLGDGIIEFELISYENRKVSVEFDGDRQHNLFLFPHRPDPDKPAANDPKVIYFGPGEHERDVVTLTDGQTLYIDYGAVLYSTVEVTGNDCTIAGHGILSGDKLRHWGEESWSNGEIILKCNPSRSVQKRGLTVRDISIINGASWNLAIWNVDDAVIDGVNIIDWGLNGDGIDLICCRGVEIKNCFIRTYDDCITLKLRHNTEYDGPYADLSDVTVHDNLIWNDFARGIVVGPESGNTELGTGHIHDIEIYDCIFLQHKRGYETDDLRSAFAIGQMSSPEGGTPTTIENVTAYNLIFDNISSTGRNVWIYQYSSPYECHMNNIVLSDFTILDGEGVVTPAIKVSADYGSITGLHFSNIVFGGSRITAEGDELEISGDVDYDIE